MTVPRYSKTSIAAAATQAALSAPTTTIRQSGQADAPDDGEEVRLATIARGAGAEMRVGVATFKGHRYIGLRLWYRAPDGSWRPDVRRGCAIRLRELAAVRSALERAAALLGAAEQDGGGQAG